MLGIRHIRTLPDTSKTDGKAERFIQTMLREWTYTIPLPSSQRRAMDLPRWLACQNQHRSMLGSHDDHRLKASPEQPDQNPQLGRVHPFKERIHCPLNAVHVGGQFSRNARDCR